MGALWSKIEMLSALLEAICVRYLRCVDCEELVSLTDTVPAGGGRCQLRKCKKCHTARRALRAWYAAAGRLQDWDQLTIEERRAMIKKNKDKGRGRGVKREVCTVERAECVDKMKLGQERPFLTEKQPLGFSLCNRGFSAQVQSTP